jgi:pimeloyl-ACP methyl ester carboxylesterase
MTTFLLVPGAGGVAWNWHRVAALLEEAGHDAVTVDLPGDDDAKGIAAYADLVVAAAGERDELVLVGLSLAGFTVAIAAPRLGARLSRIVLVNAMIPLPGETPSAWMDATASTDARITAARRGGYTTAMDLATYFFHDLPQDLAAEAERRDRDESPAAFREPARFEGWPAVPIDVVVGKDDRLFPPDFQVKVARERLASVPGVAITLVAGGHMAPLSAPRELADVLLLHRHTAKHGLPAE